MKQKIFASFLSFSLLLLIFPVSAQADSFFSHRDIRQIRNRVEQRDEQIRNRLCYRFLNTALPMPAWCELPPAPPPPPPPPLEVDHLLITEIYYDVDATHGSEGANEWVEIYNGTGSPVNLGNWVIADSAGFDLLPEDTILADNSFAIITSDASTAGFWNWPQDTLVIVLPNSIGSNSLTNTGDAVFLKNTADEIVDSVSYGTNTDAFNPSVPSVAPGHSIMRLGAFTDTDTAGDWVDVESPGPGGAG